MGNQKEQRRKKQEARSKQQESSSAAGYQVSLARIALSSLCVLAPLRRIFPQAQPTRFVSFVPSWSRKEERAKKKEQSSKRQSTSSKQQASSPARAVPRKFWVLAPLRRVFWQAQPSCFVSFVPSWSRKEERAKQQEQSRKSQSTSSKQQASSPARAVLRKFCVLAPLRQAQPSRKVSLLSMFIFLSFLLSAQQLQIGMETTIGAARTTFEGNLEDMVGFSELEITSEQVDSAFASFDLDAPRWLKELFPGLRIDIAQEITRQLTRPVRSVRVFANYRWVGGSFTVSDPRLAQPLESRKLSNQWRAVRLSLSGEAEALAEHLAVVALADAKTTKPFFQKRYDLEAYVNIEQCLPNYRPLLEWGEDSSLGWELTSGLRFTADPSPVVDLGSILFISQKIDSLLEGGLLRPVENTTDQIAEAIQNVVFGKFKDPRIVPSLGWFVRAQVPVNFGGGFSFVAGAEFSLQNHLAIEGTRPMTSIYGFGGLRYNIIKKRR